MIALSQAESIYLTHFLDALIHHITLIIYSVPSIFWQATGDRTFVKAPLGGGSSSLLPLEPRKRSRHQLD